MQNPNWRELFELPDDVCYLNAASWSLQAKTTSQLGTQAVLKKQQAWKINTDEFFVPIENLRAEFAKLVKSTPEHIAIIPAVSYGVETALKNLKLVKNKKILMPKDDFPSDVYPYLELQKSIGFAIEFVERKTSNHSSINSSTSKTSPTTEQTWTEAFLAAIDENTQLVSVPNCDWSSGAAFDLKKISAACKKFGCQLVVDLSQSLGAVPVDIHEIDPDFMFCVGYKWQLGPYGLSYMWVHEKHWQGIPLENNWINRNGSQNFAGLTNYTDLYASGAKRFDNGQRSHFVLAGMSLSALQLLNSVGVESINGHLRKLTNRLCVELEKLNIAHTSAEQNLGHMLGLYFSDANQATRTVAELKQKQIYVAQRGHYVRVSPHLYNNENDIDVFVSALKHLS